MTFVVQIPEKSIRLISESFDIFSSGGLLRFVVGVDSRDYGDREAEDPDPDIEEQSRVG